jgi:hypothetical protein
MHSLDTMEGNRVRQVRPTDANQLAVTIFFRNETSPGGPNLIYQGEQTLSD